jgi:TonB-linked SusC/RagA family outer membrane protein
MQKIIEEYFYVRDRSNQSTSTIDPDDPTVGRGIQKTMKITTAIILIAALHVSASGVAQKITFAGENVPLTKVFNAIEDQLGFGVLMPHNLLESSKPVSVKIESGTLDDLLQKCFNFQPWKLSYNIIGHTIFISRANLMFDQSKSIPLPGKNVKVTGTVYNEFGQPLSGANITIKETEMGTTTNVRGEFDLGTIPLNSTIIVSFIGYTPKQLKITDGTNAKIYLTVAKNELDKVVIQAYGTTTERLNTGNIATVTADQIERQPVMNPLLALNGEVPGVIVTPTSGYASAPIKVEIRGRSTIADVNVDPLYIIDGVPLTVLDLLGTDYESGSPGFTQAGTPAVAGGQSPFFSVNPQDIESITVLKDADATAIYGSRGANGVILITTKKGKAGKAKFTIKAYNGFEYVPRMYTMLNTKQYLSMRKEAFSNDSIRYGVTINSDPGNAYDLLEWDSSRYTNWQKYNWGGTGKTTDAQLEYSGGDKQTTFRVSGNYHRETSFLSVSGANQRISIQSNLSTNSLDQRLKISFTNLFSYTLVNLVGYGDLTELPPNAPAPFTPSGGLNWAPWETSGLLNSTFANLLEPYSSSTLFLNSQLSAKYEILKGMSVSINLGYSTNENSGTSSDPLTSLDPLYGQKASATFRNTKMSRWITEPQLEYDRFISKGKLNVLVGGTEQFANANSSYVYGYGYTNDNLLQSISNAPSYTASDGSAQYKYAAIFGRINYNWESKYILNLTVRRDGSSRFGPGKQFGNFGAAGGAWIFSEENWFKDHIRFISFAKLRASYGSTGSDIIGDYGYLTRWSANNIVSYQGSAAYVPLQLSNPNLQWQVNKKLETALNLGFLKDNLNLEIARYQNRTGNQLLTVPLPGITGFSSVSTNAPPLVQNLGWEGIVRAKLVNSKNITWDVNFNVGINRNKLISFPGLAGTQYAYQYLVGQPLNLARLLHYTGVDPLTGLYTFLDKNHDGVIDQNIQDVQNDLFIYNLNQNFEGGFGTDFAYKAWSLHLFFHYRSISNVTAADIDQGNLPGFPDNQSSDVLNHWQKPGDHAKFARYTTVGETSDYLFGASDGVFSNGSFIRLQNLSLNYNIPANVIRKAKLQECRIYLQGENLFLITGYKGPDPETPSFGNLPLSRTITGGIQLTF